MSLCFFASSCPIFPSSKTKMQVIESTPMPALRFATLGTRSLCTPVGKIKSRKHQVRCIAACSLRLVSYRTTGAPLPCLAKPSPTGLIMKVNPVIVIGSLSFRCAADVAGNDLRISKPDLYSITSGNDCQAEKDLYSGQSRLNSS